MYTPNSTPRRRQQSVPTMPQMVRRRAASPGGQPPSGTLMGAMPKRRLPQMPQPGGHGGGVVPVAPINGGGGYAQPLPGTPTHMPPGGFDPNDVKPDPYDQQPQQPGDGTYWGANPNDRLETYDDWHDAQHSSTPGPILTPPPGNPMDHLSWWQNQGWTWNGSRFVQDKMAGPGGRPNPQGGNGGGGGGNGGGGNGTGGSGNGNGNGGPNSGGNGGGGDPPPPNVPGPTDPGPIDPATGLPLDAYFEAQRRMLDDQLAGRLGGINPQYGVIDANQRLQEARLNTNEGVDQRHMLESLAGRGMFGGGVQNRDQGYLSTDYMRQRGDLGQQLLGQRSQLDLQRSQAQGDYSSGLMEALMALAQRQAQSQYTVN